MNQNFCNSNSSGFDQSQTPQSRVIHPPPQETKLFHEPFNDVQNIHEELAEYINTSGWNHPAFYNDDDDDDDVDYTIEITPVLSIEEPDNSLSIGNEHLDTIPVTKSDEVIKSSVEDLVSIPSESEGIPDTMCDVHLVNNPTPLEAKDHFEIVINSNDDISSSDDDTLYYENIEYVEASSYDSELVSLEVAKIVIPKDEEIKDDNLHEKLLNSSSTSPKSFLEETNTFDNSLPEFENFCFDLEENNSSSTTTHSDISLSDFEAFYFDDDHIEEISSGVTLLMRSSPMNSLTSYLQRIEDDHSPLLTYVVWIFLAYLTYPVIPLYLHSSENKDTIFDPGIVINRFYSFKPGLSHRCGTFKKFNTHRSHVNESPMEMLFSTCFPMD
uniref:Uncharacterized protein n=1 Tax=Tanacetum cinerariifolium TaxID=118510 RepID=A0A699GJA6_TANCI|nr:hypothetical protein [Tanacetum cinerariifolium]